MNKLKDPLEECADKSLSEIEYEYRRNTFEKKEPETWEEMLDLIIDLRKYIDNIIEIMKHRALDEYLNTTAKMEETDKPTFEEFQTAINI